MDTNTWYEITERFGEQIDLIFVVGLSLIAANIFILSGIIHKQDKDCKDHTIIAILGACIIAFAASAALGYTSRTTSILVLECVGDIEKSLCEDRAECGDTAEETCSSCNKRKLAKHYGHMERMASLQVLTFALGVIGFLIMFIVFPLKVSQAMRSR